MKKFSFSAYKDIWSNLTGEAVGEAEIFFIMKRVVDNKGVY